MILALFSFALGATFASFAGVVAYRVPLKISIVKPDSFCPSCKEHIKWYDNIPIVSYLVLRGRCRRCGANIGFFSFICETACGVSFFITYIIYGNDKESIPEVLLLFALTTLCAVIATIDFESHCIYDSTLVALFILCVAISTIRYVKAGLNMGEFSRITTIGTFTDLQNFLAIPSVSFIMNRILSSILGFSFFETTRLLSRKMLHKEALGSGDVWIVGICGCMLTCFELLLAVFLSSALGSIVETIRIKRNKSLRGAEIAFAPYLLIGILALAICGEFLENLYWEVIL